MRQTQRKRGVGGSSVQGTGRAWGVIDDSHQQGRRVSRTG